MSQANYSMRIIAYSYFYIHIQIIFELNLFPTYAHYASVWYE